MTKPNLIDAIRVVKENERLAAEKYSEAAAKISNPFGKQLFEQLSSFERFHFEKISALEKSLQETGEFVHYAGKEFPTPPIFEIEAAKEPNKKSVMQIISEAMELEKEAQNIYTSLAGQCPDQQGRDMFSRLSNEEHTHFLILSEAYWSLNETGVWKWSRS